MIHLSLSPAKQTLAGTRLVHNFITQHGPNYKDTPTMIKKDAQSNLYFSPTLGDYRRFVAKRKQLPESDS